eukprot:GFUD01004855.1.p1 GENE.GFUD01004855.1~~GFUD01004855.1.p1  ORF type:complete len:129 (-),score=57.28 GFUD01004855.1:213-599(-)
MVKLAKVEGQPKRPMSAYFLWMNEEGRANAKKELPGAGVADISKNCGAQWKVVEEATKKKYEKKQAELKKKYDIEMPLWLENGGKELLDAAKKDQKRKQMAAKKAPKGKKKRKDESEEDEVSEEEFSD